VSIQSNNRQRGKAHQKRIAEELSGMNVGTLGGEDVVVFDPPMSVECKSRKKFIGESWFAQCTLNNKRKVTPVVTVHIVGKGVDNDIVMLRMKDFKELLKKIKGV
jgi:hypothetical protein